MLIANSLECAYGLAQLRLRGHRVIMVSDTWSDALDGREFTGERLRWRGDIHATDSPARTTNMPPRLTQIANAGITIPNVTKDLPALSTIAASSSDHIPSSTTAILSTPLPQQPNAGLPANHLRNTSIGPVESDVANNSDASLVNTTRLAEQVPPTSKASLPVPTTQLGANVPQPSTVPDAFPGEIILPEKADMSSNRKEGVDKVLISPGIDGNHIHAVEIAGPSEYGPLVPNRPTQMPSMDELGVQVLKYSDTFQPLVDVLLSERNSGRLSTAHTRLDHLLKGVNDNVYRLAGVNGIREYLEQAQSRNIVFFTGGDWDVKDVDIVLRSQNASGLVPTPRITQDVFRFDFTSTANQINNRLHMQVAKPASSVKSKPYRARVDTEHSMTRPCPPKFRTLVAVLQEMEQKGGVKRVKLASLLLSKDEKVFERAGFGKKKRFTKYLDAAQSAGIVMTGKEGKIRLARTF